MASPISPPPFDPDIAPLLAAWPTMRVLEESVFASLRRRWAITAEQALAGEEVSYQDREVPGLEGSPPVTLAIIRPKSVVTPGEPTTTTTATTIRLYPAIYWIHGGGYLVGSRFAGIGKVIKWATQNDAVIISVEYRLSPEHPYPAGLDDCYAGLQWTSKHLHELGLDKAKLMVAGESAGGGLAAAVALLCRDRDGPALCAQLLLCPMIDDRNESCSARQFPATGVWVAHVNGTAWSWYLAKEKERIVAAAAAASSPSVEKEESISIYAAPGRATDLSNLPPAFIDCGSAEVFRDEAVAYASLLWVCGGSAELHIWPGGCHGFGLLGPNTPLGKAESQAQAAWVTRILSR